MRRYWIVARHELLSQLRRKSFLFFAFVFPLLMIGMEVGIGWLSARSVEETGTLGTIGYVDLSGMLAPELEKPDEFLAFEDETSAEAALQAGEIGAYFIIPADYLLTGAVNAYTYDSIGDGIKGQLRGFLRANLLAERDPLEAERLRRPAVFTLATLDGRRELDEGAIMALVFTPIIFALVFSMSITMTSSFLMQNVAEEKETRMVELMMTSITPLDMLWGKILGLGALGLLQIIVWSVAGGAIFTLSRDAGEMLSTIDLPLWLFGIAILYLLLGYLLYGSMMAGIGASSSSAQEAQSISAVFTLLAISPLFAFATFIEGANGVVPTIMSLVPLTAPTAMMMRLALGQVASWQLILSLILLASAGGGVVWLAAWTFRVGLLMTGKRLGPKTLLKMIRQGADQMITTMDSDSTA